MIVKHSVCYFILFTLFLTSCQHSEEKIEVITFHPTDYDVMLLRNNADTGMEEIYLDAIIELKAEYPSEFKQVSSEAKPIPEIDMLVNHDENPTLLITKDGQTVKELSGDTSKKEILAYLEMTMDK
ncbi:thioredoxin domain-containing protein [Virgibacillus kimchii]